jgi:hypothetical protein
MLVVAGFNRTVKGTAMVADCTVGLTEDLKVGSACAKTNNAASLESRKARGARIFQQAFTCHQATLGSEWVLPPAKALIEDMRPGDAHWYVSALRYSSAWSTQYFASDKP